MTWNSRRQIRVICRISEVILVLIVIHLIIQPHVYLHIEKTGEEFTSPCQCAGDPSIRYSFDNLTMISRRNGMKIQRIWERELLQVNRSLIGKTIEEGGEPERIIVVSTWRSGSSYVGTILRSRPATHYFFEPLYNSYADFAVRTDAEAEKALSILYNLFHCRDQGRHITKLERNDSFFSRNPRLLEMAELQCIQWDPTFVTLMCRRSPFLAMKTVRLSLRHASKLLENEKLNVKMVYLVRDPQATALSRLQVYWCKQHDGCGDFRQLCLNLVQDFHVAKELEKKYSQRFMVLHYEDILAKSRTANKFAHFLSMSEDAFLTNWTNRPGSARMMWESFTRFNRAVPKPFSSGVTNYYRITQHPQIKRGG